RQRADCNEKGECAHSFVLCEIIAATRAVKSEATSRPDHLLWLTIPAFRALREHAIGSCGRGVGHAHRRYGSCKTYTTYPINPLRSPPPARLLPSTSPIRPDEPCRSDPLKRMGCSLRASTTGRGALPQTPRTSNRSHPWRPCRGNRARPETHRDRHPCSSSSSDVRCRTHTRDGRCGTDHNLHTAHTRRGHCDESQSSALSARSYLRPCTPA